jgi:hypothetical protein
MEPFDRLIGTILALFTLISISSGSPIPAQDAYRFLVPRGFVSPTNDELIHNTIAFGVPALIAFALRM